jgi:aspartyl-tRNA(Asn)/glutamyl-tRNA(Gln) amidotransferase subunit A
MAAVEHAVTEAPIELWSASAVELGRAYHARELSPVEVLDAILARCERVNPRLNAIVTLDVDGAREAATQSSARWRAGAPLSPFDGVPITIKDNLIVAGLRSTWGSRLYEKFLPDRDELPVARLRAAGLVFVGKTNVPEFTLQGYTDNLIFGPTRNPWNPRLTPGGSSGGAVAAVAAGMAPVAIGTDGGGSIRRPAAHAGLVGLKPTVGRVPRDGGFPAILHDFEVVGPIARDVADVAGLMALLAGPDRRDPASLRWSAWSESQEPPIRKRVLYVPSFGDAPVDPQIGASVTEAAEALAALGCEVEQGDVPFEFDDVARAFTMISAAGLAWLLRGHENRMSTITSAMQSLAENGGALTAADYVDALAIADRLKRRLAALFDQFDILMTPAVAALPWPAERSHPEAIAGRPVGPRGHAVFTAFANVSGCPGLSLPCASSRSGLPIGFQLVAAPGKDEALVALGRAYEAVRPWRERRPALEAA